MSFKENLDYIRSGMNADEKMLSGMFQAERFLKKYKIPLIVVGIVLVVGVLGFVIKGEVNEYFAQKNAEIYEKALAGDKDAQEQLQKQNSTLYELYSFSNALNAGDEGKLAELANSKEPMIARLASYQLANIKGDSKAIENAQLGEWGLLGAAIAEISKNNKKAAGEYLAKVPSSSPLKAIATALEHLNLENSQDSISQKELNSKPQNTQEQEKNNADSMKNE